MPHPSSPAAIAASHERAIAALEKRQTGRTYLEPLRPEVAEKQIAAHRAAIRRHLGLAPTPPPVDSFV